MRAVYHNRVLRDAKGRPVGHWHAVIYRSRESLYNWLDRHDSSPGGYNTVNKLRGQVAILRYIETDSRRRGKGFGGQGLDEFFEYAIAKKCSHAMLVADVGNPQKKGFTLLDWYRRRGFRVAGTAWGGPAKIMLCRLT